jgi:hypothetical protein
LSSDSEVKLVSIPGIRQYYTFPIETIDDVVNGLMSPYVIISSLQYKKDSAKVVIHAMIDGYPSGNMTSDLVYQTQTFVMTSIRYGSRVQFYVEMDNHDPSAYIQDSLEVSLLLRKGRMCERGCGVNGECNLATGKCNCMNEKGWWGESCQEKGCVQGEECKNEIGKGIRVCEGSTKFVCRLTSCNDQDMFMKLDTTQNKCVRSFPTEIFAGAVGGTGGACLLLGVALTSLFCCCRNRKRNYHYIDH